MQSPRPRSGSSSRPSRGPRELLGQYIAGFENADTTALEKALRADAAIEMVGTRTWFSGRVTCLRYLAHVIGSPGDWRMIPTLANGQPAAAAVYRGSAFGLGVLTVTPGWHRPHHRVRRRPRAGSQVRRQPDRPRDARPAAVTAPPGHCRTRRRRIKDPHPERMRLTLATSPDDIRPGRRDGRDDPRRPPEPTGLRPPSAPLRAAPPARGERETPGDRARPERGARAYQAAAD